MCYDLLCNGNCYAYNSVKKTGLKIYYVIIRQSCQPSWFILLSCDQVLIGIHHKSILDDSGNKK